ncbi:major facilitator superfamily domain-containing protein, partial [Aspergillus avenaceus]
MTTQSPKPWGYRWRSSKAFIISTVTIALFAETFLFSFVVPILGYMLEIRLRLDPSKTQRFTTAIMTSHGFISLVAAPVIAHYADKTPNRKIPLLISLGVCLTGTLLIASTFSLELLFAGRVLQAAAGSAAWIVGFATLSDNVGLEHMGKLMGMSMSFVAAGTISGPMVSGTLLQLFGYWPTWSAPVAVVSLDIVARLIMIEQRESSPSDPEIAPILSKTDHNAESESDERSALLPPSPQPIMEPVADTEVLTSPSAFYCTMIRDTRAVAALANTLLFSGLLGAFDATLPLHLRYVFHWETGKVGMIFLALQIPSICLGPVVGWLRDRVGVRPTVTLGWVLMAPLLWLMGVPGHHSFPWASPESHGESIFVAAMFGFGTAFTLVRGAGTMQLV